MVKKKTLFLILKYSASLVGLIVVSFFLLCVFLALIPVEKEKTEEQQRGRGGEEQQQCRACDEMKTTESRNVTNSQSNLPLPR